MKRKYQYGCSVCKTRSRPKRLPYGSKRGKFWCDHCDCNLVTPVKKKSERMKSRLSLKKLIDYKPNT